MFIPKKMRKVRIIVLKTEVEKLIRDLHELGLVQISKAKYEGLEEGRPLPAFDELSAYLVKLRGILSIMEGVAGKTSESLALIDPMQAIEEAKKLGLESRMKELTKQADADSALVKELSARAELANALLPFGDIDFSRLKTRTLDYRLGKCQNVPALKDMASKMDDTTVLSKGSDDNALIVFRAKNKDAIDSILSGCGFTPIDLDQSFTTPKDTLARLNAQMSEAKRRLDGVKNELREIAQQHMEKVKMLINSIEIGTQRAEIANKFANSRSLYVIQGWIVDGEYGKLDSVIQKYHTTAMLESMTISHEEKPPIVFNNPKIATPFEFLTRNYSLPNYFEIDPTMAYFIALPIIYGMIVGDVLYGLISILLAMWFMKKFAKSEIMMNVSMIWLYSAFPAILFGIIFDEWGGMSHYDLMALLTKWTGVILLKAPLYTGLHRIENVLTLVGITVVVGLVHLALGFLFGAINEWNHNRKHSFGKLAWIGLEIGIMLALSAAIFQTPFLVAGLAVILGSIIVVVFAEGILGIIEIPGLVGNALSYTRIAAVGIVGVVIAGLLDQYLVPVPSQGLLAVLLVPIYIGLHLINCFIAMFESLIQGGRLNIVEFRSKFLHGGDSLFVPFAMRNAG